MERAFKYGDIGKGRIGLNIEFDISYDGHISEKTLLYLPISSSQLKNTIDSDYYISLIEIETKHSQKVLELSVTEIIAVIVLFVAIGYFVSFLCHRRTANVVPFTCYGKTDRVILELNDNEKLNMSQMSKSGPDYVQF